MAKKKTDENLNLDNILFKCRDILRKARNSGSYFEKRDMMLTLVFLRFIGEKFEDGVEKLRQELIAVGLDPDDKQIIAAFLDDPIIVLPGGDYHGRKLRNREREILFMDLRTWTENFVKGENKKKVLLNNEQIQRAAGIYHTWQSEGINGEIFEEPELFRSVGIDEIEKQSWSLVPSKYIKFVDHDLDIDFNKEMQRIQTEMKTVLKQEKESQKMLKNAFDRIGYGID